MSARDGLLRPYEAARILGVSVDEITRLTATGALRVAHTDASQHRWYDPADIQALKEPQS